MLSFLVSWLLPLLLAIEGIPEGLPGSDPQPDKPSSAVAPSYFEMLEQNSHIIYPGLAVLTLGLIAFGILQAWRSQDMSAAAKTEYKKLVVDELRRNPAGLSGDELARFLGLERHRTVALLEEMQTDNLLVSHNSSRRVVIWRLKGVGMAARY